MLDYIGKYPHWLKKLYDNNIGIFGIFQKILFETVSCSSDVHEFISASEHCRIKEEIQAG